MKLHYLALACLIILFSQDGIAQGSEIELQFIPSLTNLRGNSFVERVADPTFHLSVSLGYNYVLKNNFLFKGAIVYDSKGADGSDDFEYRDDFNNPIGTRTIEMKNDYKYITVPLQFGRRFGKKVKFDVAFGGYASFFIKNVLQFVADGDVSTASRDEHNNAPGEMDFGLTGSASVYLPLGKKLSFKLGIQDNLGLVDISKYNDLKYTGDGVKHNSMGLHVGLNLRLASTAN
ncbi:MAG: hypothetical protein QM762_18260 [Chryseolinea sp.]